MAEAFTAILKLFKTQIPVDWPSSNRSEVVFVFDIFVEVVSRLAEYEHLITFTDVIDYLDLVIRMLGKIVRMDRKDKVVLMISQ